MNRSKLRQFLDGYFSEEDLQDLCFDLEIDYANLPGVAKKDKARELVIYAEKNGRLPELISLARGYRPNAPWEQVLGSTADPRQELDRLAQEYDVLRARQQAGDEQVETHHLDNLIMHMRDAGMVLFITPEELKARLYASSEGARMSALAYLYANPDQKLLHDLLEIKGPPVGPHRANEEYHALLAVDRLVSDAALDIRPKLHIREQLQKRKWQYQLGLSKTRVAAIDSILSKLENI